MIFLLISSVSSRILCSVMEVRTAPSHPELVGYERPTNTHGAALLLGCSDKRVLGYIKDHNEHLKAWKAGKTWCVLPSNVERFRVEVLPSLHHQRPPQEKVQ